MAQAKKKKKNKKKTKKASASKSKKQKRSSRKAATVEVLQPEIIDDPAPPENSKAIAAADPVAQYMQEIRKYRILSREEEHKLAVQYHETQDPKIAEILVTSNLRFVVKVAAEYARFGARLIDLIQEGNVGLMHAVKEFNPYKGVKLITYAVWWIRGYIQDYLMRQYSMVRIGTTQNQRKLFYQLQKQKAELDRLGFDEGVALLSGRLGIPENEVKTMAQRMSGRDLSLDKPVGEDGGTTFIDIQSTPTDLDPAEELGAFEEISRLREKVDDLRDELNERESYLLENRLLSDEPKTLQEIGDQYGITREAVRQMEVRLIQKIKQRFLEST